MKLNTPRWWYVRNGAPAPVMRALLRPVSWLWAYVTARKIAQAKPFDPGAPVICVGNLTLGGTGKTPIVRELITRLTERGVAAHGLTRGYGGRLKGPLRVDPARHTATEVGDEPLMLAGAQSIWISRNRPAGAKAAVQAGAQAIVMDDGHQNPSLKKTLSLVVVDGETRSGEWPFGDGAVFPSGPMREPLARGLTRADAVVLMLATDVAEADPELLALFAGKPVLIARLAPCAPPPPGPQLAFAGVGKPWKVARSLKAAGCELVDFAGFPDHAFLSQDTLAALEERARAYGAGLLTTEKDWVRLPPPWRAKVKAWPVRAVFEDEAALERLLDLAVSS
ncbi:MAG TPA: tetraacyldisaccharide 4'-kinase [Caulobacteraceae bacterium]|nr:tetraacyldisaccharide 4'-kinase [Caulobacteraceae bacterium]